MDFKNIVITIVNFIQTMLNYMVIWRTCAVISSAPLTLTSGPCGKVWWIRSSSISNHKVIHKINYLYNNTIYTYISKTPNPPWPPENKPREMGFRAAIKSAKLVIKENETRDCTRVIKRLAGPRGDWHQRRFSPKEIFGEDCSNVILSDVLGQDRVVDGDETFYASTVSGSESDAK